MKKRSNEKKITKEAIILRYMRHTKKLSLNQAGRSVHISGSAIAHIEQGRMDVSRARLQTLVKAYGFTWGDYMDLFDSSEIPISLRDECLTIIKQLDEIKLQAVHAVLINFMPMGSTRTMANPSHFQRSYQNNDL